MYIYYIAIYNVEGFFFVYVCDGLISLSVSKNNLSNIARFNCYLRPCLRDATLLVRKVRVFFPQQGILYPKSGSYPLLHSESNFPPRFIPYNFFFIFFACGLLCLGQFFFIHPFSFSSFLFLLSFLSRSEYYLYKIHVLFFLTKINKIKKQARAFFLSTRIFK